MARTYVLIAPVQYVSCSYETIPNAPKYYKTDRHISLGSNGLDWVRSLRKMSSWLRGTNFCMNWTSSVCFATSFMQLRNDPKCTQIQQNGPKHLFRVQWGGLGAFVAKNDVVIRGTNFCKNWTSSICFATSFMQLRNDPKCTQIQQNRPNH